MTATRNPYAHEHRVQTHPIALVRNVEGADMPLAPSFITRAVRENDHEDLLGWDKDWTTPLTIEQAKRLRDELTAAIEGAL